MKVLIVDDNRVNSIVTSKFLIKWGFEANTAINGKEAIEKVQAEDYDIVLMDLNMPEMNGYESSEEIRKLEGEKFKNMPIIAVTASTSQEISEQILSVGMNDYILKPFSPEELHDKIHQYIK